MAMWDCLLVRKEIVTRLRRYCLEARGKDVKIIARFTCTFQNIVVSLHCEMSVNTHQ